VTAAPAGAADEARGVEGPPEALPADEGWRAVTECGTWGRRQTGRGRRRVGRRGEWVGADLTRPCLCQNGSAWIHDFFSK
jgi:hypothetical protein